MKALIPRSEGELGGPFITVEDDRFHVLAEREEALVIEFSDAPPEIAWLDDFEMLYCQRQHDSGTIKVIRKATEEERKRFRIPLWIQGEDVPECCGQPMHFVGQIDDDNICAERPEGAELWWHDVASFYVFSCAKCLGCKAVGQQY
ncbi:MAG: hypothetical protein JXA69_15850 [Phycisphaerae bacterium]|nr:hypothetical protein [Phycisphaerae bacterium]